MNSAREKSVAPNLKSDRRLSLPVTDLRMDYKDRLRFHASTSSHAMKSSGENFEMNKKGEDEEDEKSMTPPIIRRRRTYSTSDMNLCIPDIIIDEVQDGSSSNSTSTNSNLSSNNFKQFQRVTFKMDHLRIGNVLAEHLNEKEQKNNLLLMKRQELANEQLTKSNTNNSSPTNRRKSVPNLKSVMEEDGGDE